MKFFFEPIPSISLGNLCEMFDNQYYGDDISDCLTTSFMMDIAQDVLDITVDGSHCGTLVGLAWFLEQMCQDEASWYAADNNDYDREKWITSWTSVYDEFMKEHNETAFYYVNVTD
jgi:hypothetical protein